jgi:hypothetical protein
LRDKIYDPFFAEREKKNFKQSMNSIYESKHFKSKSQKKMLPIIDKQEIYQEFLDYTKNSRSSSKLLINKSSAGDKSINNTSKSKCNLTSNNSQSLFIKQQIEESAKSYNFLMF